MVKEIGKYRISVVFYWVGWVCSVQWDKLYKGITLPFGSFSIEDKELSDRLYDLEQDKRQLVEQWNELEAHVKSHNWDYDEMKDLSREINQLAEEICSIEDEIATINS